MKEGLDFPPMNIAADRLTKDGANQVFVFVANGGTLGRRWPLTCLPPARLDAPRRAISQCYRGRQCARSQGSSLSHHSRRHHSTD
jgi:hypothetical protein